MNMKIRLLAVALTALATAGRTCQATLASADIHLAPGQAVEESITVTASCEACTPCEVCPPVAVCPPKTPGKGHGAVHTAYSATQYATCKDCHSAGNEKGEIPASWPGSLCPSQGPEFANPTLLSKFKLPALTKYGQTFTLSDGNVFTDRMTGNPIVVGGQLGGYAPGEVPMCIHCHSHYGTSPGNLGWKKELIHYGCLDCHVSVKNGAVKAGIKELLSK